MLYCSYYTYYFQEEILKVKGIAFISTASFLKRKFGFLKYSAFLTENPGFKTFENYSPVAWYQIESLIDFHTKADSFFGYNDLSLVQETAVVLAEDAFDTSFRIFKNLSAKLIISHIQPIINTCYHGFIANAEQKHDSAALVEIEGKFESSVLRRKFKSWLCAIIAKTSGKKISVEELKSPENKLKLCVQWED